MAKDPQVQSELNQIQQEFSITDFDGLQELIEKITEIQAKVPSEEWDKIPHDGSINHDHYLYGSPKVEEC